MYNARYKKSRQPWLDVPTVFEEMSNWNKDHAKEFMMHLISTQRMSDSDTRTMFKSNKSLWSRLTTDTIDNSSLTAKQWVLFISREKPKLPNDIIEHIFSELTMELLNSKSKKTIPLTKAINQVKEHYDVV